VLRRLLGRWLGREPGSLRFAQGPAGKPYLAGLPLSFNVAHSEDLAAWAVAADGDVGIDVEWVRPDFDVLPLAEAHFTPGEAARLRGLPAAERGLAFFRCWTIQEAFAKAAGVGLRPGPNRAAVTPAGGWRFALRELESADGKALLAVALSGKPLAA
jgi:4'-phosphopantetheinyl transferase